MIDNKDEQQWYLAELVEEVSIEDDPDNVIHTNLVLLHASSPDDAYAKAIQIGRRGETSYTNPAGRNVKIEFRGLHDLNVTIEDPADGAEIGFTRQVNVSASALQEWLLPKNRLSAFIIPEPKSGPDYSASYILEKVSRL